MRLMISEPERHQRIDPERKGSCSIGRTMKPNAPICHVELVISTLQSPT
jgi:hypothetical protein